eukprot:gnl/MRDRNA2_/MRDRNA2_86514_c0_seq10.p1 gnl/MRDRNA2_/MRDRNA2_86514_c0~~gnl/MRDRNA2_/MRDRNA2_86514_c0_seq10.p1  ORF type:complete len:392 (+),score=92.51 gnl/MRDRNA2_/MRDRNA2_86514_c0_seq10:29-1177(+)
MFPTIEDSMWELLLNGTFMDSLGDSMKRITAEDRTLAALFLLFVFLSNLTVLNMLIGIICEVASDVSQKEKARMAEAKFTGELLEILQIFDMHDDQMITCEEFNLMLSNPDMRQMLTRNEINLEVLETIKDSIFLNPEANEKEKWKSVSYDELIGVILRFRGGDGEHATILDIVNLDKSIRSHIKQADDVKVTEMKPGMLEDTAPTSNVAQEDLQRLEAKLDATKASIEASQASLEASLETKFQRLEALLSSTPKEESSTVRPLNRLSSPAPEDTAPPMALLDVNEQANSLQGLVVVMHQMQGTLKHLVPDIATQAHGTKPAWKSIQEIQCTLNTLECTVNTFCVCFMEFSKLFANSKSLQMEPEKVERTVPQEWHQQEQQE